jgi:hypothetical protein
MEKNQINPDKITKPIQLLGAWLVGLLAIDASFLFAAIRMGTDNWQASALTIAAIINVPFFIGALFLLQTRFRPELQEDSYYSTYLNSKTNELVKVAKRNRVLSEIESKLESIEKRQLFLTGQDGDSLISGLNYGVNVNLSNQEQILEVLFDKGIGVVREFGEGLNKPNGMTVALASGLSNDVKQKILAMASDLGFTHYSTIHPWEEIDEDVLFGAYADAEGRIVTKSL